MKQLTTLAVLAAVTGLAASAHAQWTVTSLHPQGGIESAAYSFYQGKPIVSVTFPGRGAWGVWDLASGSFTEFEIEGATRVVASGSCGAQLVGTDSTAHTSNAFMWPGVSPDGTALPIVNLHPAGARYSYAFGTSGDQQVGAVIFDGNREHASLWRGTAASWVDLDPAGSTFSRALESSGTQQVGWANVNGGARASLWSGTADSWIDLTPMGAAGSWGYAIDGAQQVGYAYFDGQIHAGLWSGTAESWVSLHPAGSSDSNALNVSDNLQVGYAYVNDYAHASLWTGTADSWVDLASFLPGSWGTSVATDVWSDGTTTYVVGWGDNTETGHEEALLWTHVQCPACAIDYDQDGGMTGGDAAAFLSDFEAGAPCADIDQDGGITGADIALFFVLSESGGC